MVLNSLSFGLSEKLLISPSYLNEILAGWLLNNIKWIHNELSNVNRPALKELGKREGWAFLLAHQVSERVGTPTLQWGDTALSVCVHTHMH